MKRRVMNIPGIDVEATGKRIGRMIKERGISDKELSKMMGISIQAINKWRHGYTIPDIENMYILSRILCVKVDDFLVPQRKAAKAEDIGLNRRLMAYYTMFSKRVLKLRDI